MKLVKVVFDSYEKGRITRVCVPFDYGPSRRYRDGENRYHFYDLDSPLSNHNLSILPQQIKSIEILNETFCPEDYVKWTPSWFLSRDWGIYS
ncbi:hypothetical protein [Clostridium septicum]|uniref:Uncharacterized protein n=1 Tax=Clostridium septicum TaxID=1504 RepID=A0A9N7JKP1_CLOSE|nr:hypothetical protein [Clostridium septicum]AYE33651.1 hypothetical protein CP523_03790 [Clostridium septicum]UEC21738.1 hypothetical protein LK444_05055 [Clostridium septicum]USS00210.1 hypothetical protein NH397_12025 [Clostridium septicum]